MRQVTVRWLNAVSKRVRKYAQGWRSWSGFCLLALITSLVLNACTLGQPTLETLKIGITTWPGFDVVRYAQTADLFKKHGLTVELLQFENQQDSSRAVLRGALDAAFVSLWDVVQVDPGNDKPAVVMVTNISHGADGIVTQAALKSVESLRGKRVGAKLGTVNHLILLEALKLHHIKPAEVTIEDVSNESAVELMAGGKLDGAVIWEPLLGDTAKKIKGNIVYTTKELDSTVIDTLVSSATRVKAKKAAFTKFASTWLDVMHAVDVEPQAVYEQVGKQIGQSGTAFGSDYAGLKKGDIHLQQQMFKQDGLKQALVQLTQLLKDDPRSGRAPRADIEIDAEPITAAIAGWERLKQLLRVRQHSLSKLLLVGFGLSLATVGLTTLWFNYRLLQADLAQEVKQRAQTITQSLEFSTEGLLAIENRNILRRVVQNYATLPAVIEIAIVSPTGQILAYSSQDASHSSLAVADNHYTTVHPELTRSIEQASLQGTEAGQEMVLDGKPVLTYILPF